MSDRVKMTHPQLTDEQITLFQEVFSLYDINEDGNINIKDLRKVMKCLGCDFTKEEVKKLTNEIDPEKVRVISFQQFLHMMSYNLKQRPTLEVRRQKVFMFFDVDQKGYITLSDLRQAMINLGERVTENDVRKMMEEAGIEKSGKVNYDEFVKIVTPKQ